MSALYNLTDKYFYGIRIDSGSYVHVAAAPATSSIYFRFKPTGSLPMTLFEIDSNNKLIIDSTGSLYFKSGSNNINVIDNALIESKLTDGFYSFLINTNTSSTGLCDFYLGYQTIMDTNIRSIKIKSGSAILPILVLK